MKGLIFSILRALSTEFPANIFQMNKKNVLSTNTRPFTKIMFCLVSGKHS